MKINLLRFVFLGYFIVLFLFAGNYNFAIGGLNYFFFFYFIQIVVLLELANLIFKRLNLTVNITPAYSAFLLYTVINSIVFAFYPQFKDLSFNRFGHFISGVIYSVIAIQIIKASCAKTESKLAKPLHFLFIFSLASTAGVFNEIIELALDVTTGSHRIGPGLDTAIDLLMNTLGILVILTVINWKNKLHTSSIFHLRGGMA